MRPKDADSAATYDRIVRAAIELLRDGDETLTLRSVAKRADLSLGTVQYYFETKHGLLEACLDGYHARLSSLANELIQHAQETDDSTALVETIVRRFYSFVREERALVSLRVKNNASAGEFPRARQSEFLGALVLNAARVLARHVGVDETDTRLAIHVMVPTVVRFALLSDSELVHIVGVAGGRERLADFLVRASLRLIDAGAARG